MMAVPTNAFQRYMLDGVTSPTAAQRLGSLLVPVVPLFRAGCLASLLGYGTTALLIQLRTRLFPAVTVVTQPVNVLYAALYTGCFMAVVSNLRYQLLQGVVEPAIENNWLLRRPERIPVVVRSSLILAVRIGNGILGSTLAIAGMQFCGLQKLK